MFDDPISALDANVGMKVMKNCIIKHLSGKTRILVTHALQYVSFSDRIIYMNNGEIKWMGTYEEIKEQEFFKVFYEKMKKENEKEEEPMLKKKTSKEKREEFLRRNSDEDIDTNNDEKKVEKTKELNTGKIKKLIQEEVKEKGKVKLSVYKDFLIKIGGVLTITTMLVLMIIMDLSRSAQDLWLGYWTEHQEQSKNTIYFLIFTLFGVVGCAFTYCKLKVQSKSNIKASRSIHKEMVESLIRAPIPTFHETVPKGQILNRFSSDINSIDRGGLNHFLNILSTLISFVTCIGICGYYEPYSLLTIPVILIIGYRISTFYRNSSRELQRIESGRRSPVLNICNEVIPGTTTIRAFGYQQKYMSLFHEKVDEHLKLRIINNGCNQWYNMNLDLISFSFVAFLITFTILFKDKFSASAVAIIYTYCDRMKISLISGLRTLTFYENSMIGYERCIEYTKCPSEAPLKNPIDNKLDNWPNLGKIEFINFSVKYRPNTEIVLKNLNFVIQGKEKVGIVGRTGSGKSTITLCLFRILEATEGKILIDDVDISKLGLEILRHNLTIIPQDPALMEGSLRYNIDPLEKSDDNEIIKVMEKIGFDYIIKRDKQGLNQEIAEGGSNLSVGEKQLICITRAILRKSKIIIMDEATASIDYKTEEIIQKAVSEILNDSTFITIAHRIKTILNYDRILTLDNGTIVDFDTPKNLLNDKNSLFYELYSKSNL
jgi:ATP-binding cassette subfamily C (CFTR/MRP) protein 1